jgi:hypothetical protein
MPSKDVMATASYRSGFNDSGVYLRKVDVEVEKVWNDGNNQDGVRPAVVTVKLLTDGNDSGKTVTLNAANSWTDSFDGLPEYDNGRKIVYTVEELSLTNGYTSAVSGSVADGFTVTNTRSPETVSIAGRATWVDNNNARGVRPVTITIRLYRNGVEIDSMDVSDIGGVWSWDFGVYPKYADGKLIEYTITEDAIDDYRISIKGFNVTNTHLHSVPFTGDDFNIGLWVGVMLLSLAALAGVTAYRYKTTRK